jgi:hypothetical protein
MQRLAEYILVYADNAPIAAHHTTSKQPNCAAPRWARERRHPLIWFIKDVTFWARYAYYRSTSHEKLTESSQNACKIE